MTKITNQIGFQNSKTNNSVADGGQNLNGRLLAENNPNVDFGGEASKQMGKIGGSIGGQMTRRLVEAGLRQLMEEGKE